MLTHAQEAKRTWSFSKKDRTSSQQRPETEADEQGHGAVLLVPQMLLRNRFSWLIGLAPSIAFPRPAVR